MKKLILLGLGAGLLAALPAAADGYADRTYTKGPSALSPHEKEVRTVTVHRTYDVQPPTHCYSGCGHYQRGATYTTAPVVTQRYTRTYTRLAPPDCYHTAPTVTYTQTYHGHGAHHGHHGHGAHHTYTYDSAHSGASSYGYTGGVTSFQRGSTTYSYAPRARTYSYGAQHLDRGKAWSHYDHGWKSKTNSRR
ncbi:MAG: hypothetical protein RLN72_14555 [Henriciella sp.]